MMKCKLLVIPALAGSLLLLGGCGYNKNNSLVVFNYGDRYRRSVQLTDTGLSLCDETD